MEGHKHPALVVLIRCFKPRLKAHSQFADVFTSPQSKAFKTPICIFLPWLLIHIEQATVHVILHTLTVLKDLYIPNLFIFTLYFHYTVRENEPQKAGTNKTNKTIYEKKMLLENRFASMDVVYLCTKTEK